MPERRSAARRFATRALSALLIAAAAFGAHAQGGGAERRRALELFAAQRMAEAIPLLESLAAKNPSDGEVIAALGVAVVTSAVSLSDETLRKRERARGRALVARAKELGVTNELVELVLSQVSPDGGPAAESFSRDAEADRLMRAGEEAFARGDYGAALSAYERALGRDPSLYEAPLFAGDVYFRQKRWDEAAGWYSRAVGIDPDRETAYRYWGNALLQQGKHGEARDKYISAVLAEPYNGYVWRNGLYRWAAATDTSLGHPKIVPSKDGRGAWAVYDLVRAAWAADDHDKFRRAYPEEKGYRHSLREEAEALRAVASAARGGVRNGDGNPPAPGLAQLVRLDDEGLLEAYILFARVGEINSLADDYAGYRATNRDKLRLYLAEYVTSGKY